MSAVLRPGQPLRLYDPLALPPREAAAVTVEWRQVPGDWPAVMVTLLQGPARILLLVNRPMAEFLWDWLKLRHRDALRGSAATLGDSEGRDVVAHLNGGIWLEASDGAVVAMDESAVLRLSAISRAIKQGSLPTRAAA